MPAEIVIQIILVILSFTIAMCCGVNVNEARMGCVVSGLGLALSVEIMKWGKHIVKLIFFEKLDINGCLQCVALASAITLPVKCYELCCF